MNKEEKMIKLFRNLISKSFDKDRSHNNPAVSLNLLTNDLDKLERDINEIGLNNTIVKRDAVYTKNDKRNN